MTKTMVNVAGLVFGFMAAVHLYRYFYDIHVQFGAFVVPQWVSLPGFIIAAILSLFLFRASSKL